MQCMCYALITCQYTDFTTLQDIVYPSDVAYPIGGPGTSRFLVIEMHYDNPGLISSKT